MAIRTKKGDDGETSLFKSDIGRVPKDSDLIESIGTVDELVAHLGLVKVILNNKERGDYSLLDSVINVQSDLYIVMAELGGDDTKSISVEKLEKLESNLLENESKLPKMTKFFKAGGNEAAARLEICRTIARRAERRIVSAKKEGIVMISDNSYKYMNAVSDYLFSLARLSNHLLGITEDHPDYL